MKKIHDESNDKKKKRADVVDKDDLEFENEDEDLYPEEE